MAPKQVFAHPAGSKGDAPSGASHSGRRILLRLLRLSAVAAVGVLVAKRVRSRSAPPEGVWREGVSGNGLASDKRR